MVLDSCSFYFGSRRSVDRRNGQDWGERSRNAASREATLVFGFR
jgi:hypothetical protein